MQNIFTVKTNIIEQKILRVINFIDVFRGGECTDEIHLKVGDKWI